MYRTEDSLQIQRMAELRYLPHEVCIAGEGGASLEGHFRKLLTLNNVSFMHSVSVALSV